MGTQRLLDELVALLDLEELDLNIFRGTSPRESRVRVFGGQVAAQALVAAGRTVEDPVAHSLHAYFLRPGDPAIPILYEVDRIRDGKSFTTRRVVAIQRGRAIFNLQASFQREEPGLDHQVAMPEAPDPETLPTWSERMLRAVENEPKEVRDWFSRPRPLELRYVEPFDPEHRRERQHVWLRANGTLPDRPLLHQCLVAYASDLTLLDTATLPHGLLWNDPRYMMASLDHAMWFHRELRADEWLLYAQESPSSSGARGFAWGHLFRRDGTLVASVAQEGLVRPIRKGA
jgi:acyl-CoA thioesterase-2